MDLAIILVVGLLFGWLANIFIEGHGLGYALDLLLATIGAFVGVLFYKNLSMPIHHFWGELFASILGSISFLLPVIFYSSKRKAS